MPEVQENKPSENLSNGVKRKRNNEGAQLKFDTIPDCIEAFRRGHFLIVLDSPDRENEGDLIISAAALTPEKCAFMIRHSSGYLCAPLTQAHATKLGLKRMVPLEDNEDPNGTAYCVSVDAAKKWGTTTGISAKERAATANILAGVRPWSSDTEVEKLPDEGASPSDLRRPGHMLPLIAREGGVRARRGHTEAGVDLARLAGEDPPVAVIGELVEEEEEEVETDGEDAKPARPEYANTGMMRAEGCVRFGRKWGIKVCTIEDLVRHMEGEEGLKASKVDTA